MHSPFPFSSDGPASGSVAQKVQDEMGRQVQTKAPDLLNPNYKFSMEEDQPEPSSSKSKAMPVAKTKSKASRKAKRDCSPSVSSIASTVTSQKDDDDEKQNIDQIKAYFHMECGECLPSSLGEQ